MAEAGQLLDEVVVMGYKSEVKSNVQRHFIYQG